MSDTRVTVHLLRDSHRERALAHLRGETEQTAAFVTGFTDDAGIEALEDAGLIVERADGPSGVFAGPDTVGTLESAGAGGGDALPESDAILGRIDQRFLSGEIGLPFLVEIEGPLLPRYIEAMRAGGAVIDEAIGRATYRTWLRVEAVAGVRGLPFVESLRRDTSVAGGTAEAMSSSGAKRAESGMAVGGDPVLLDIRQVRALADAAPVREAIAELGGEIVDDSGRKLRVSFPPGTPIGDVAALLGRLPEVEMAEPFVPAELHQQHARPLIGLPDIMPPLFDIDGTGQIIAIADSGIDGTHGDFAGRIEAAIALGRAGDASDPHGHGTHVAGSAAGSGRESGGDITGIAPASTLYFQSIMDSRGELGGLPTDLGNLFGPAHDAGARIHNNSWGELRYLSRYSISSVEVDEFVHENQEMLIVFSAGNKGTARHGVHAAPGFPDLFSITPPATAKNALTIGAQRSDRTTGGWADRTYDSVWPGDFPDPPIGTAKISGDPEGLAAFSSRGPTGDERIKPDMVAPGTSILSARSGDAPDESYWDTESDHDGKYAYMGGTSMAAPIVAGAAALVRQYYIRDKAIAAPSAALVKATLINGARFLGGSDSTASNTAAPNYDQGFGALDLRRTLPNADRPGLVLEAVDAITPASGAIGRTGDVRRYRLEVTAPSPLNICLAWSDPPGRGLQNDLDLFLTMADGSVEAVGNADRVKLRPGFDRHNNVEVVRLENALPGYYEIQVRAWTILRSPQSFALVATGALNGTLLDIG